MCLVGCLGRLDVRRGSFARRNGEIDAAHAMRVITRDTSLPTGLEQAYASRCVARPR